MNEKNVCKKVKMLANLTSRKIATTLDKKGIPDFTGGHGYIVCFIANSKVNVFQKDIEKEFKIRRSTVTTTLNLMEKNGIIMRESVKSDNRLKRISLTQKGYEYFEIFKKHIEETENEIESVLTDEEKAVFSKIIEKLISTFEN